MVSSTRQTIACLLMIVGFAICGHSQSSPSIEPATTIGGKVTVQGKAVQGVVITLRSNEGTSYRQLMNQRGVTNSNGEYRIANVPPGSYIVAPAVRSFVATNESGAERAVIVNKAETIEDFDFSLMTGAVITGRVLDPDGRPIIEEEVYLFPVRETPMMGSSRETTTTDDRGVYRIFGLKPGAYKVAAGSDDSGWSRGPRAVHTRTYYPDTSDLAQATVIQVNEGTEVTDIDITVSRLLTTYTATGRIVDGQTGQPVANVGYGFTRFAGANISRVSRGDITNERGEFKLANLAPGQYALTVMSEPESHVRVEELRFEVVDQDITGLVAKTLKGTSLSGIVTLESAYDNAIREQFRNAKLVAFVETEATRTIGTPGVTSVIGPGGSFRIGGLPAGKATFRLSALPRFQVVRVERNGIVQSHGLKVKQLEDITGLRIVVGYADASLRGAVELENGSLPPNGRVSVWARRLSEELGWSAQIDARGQFVFEALVPGTYELIVAAFAPGSRRPLAQKKQQVVLVSGSTSNITVQFDLNAPKPNP